MTTRELINALLDSPMDEEVKLYIEKNHTDEYGIECFGWLFPIDSIEHKVLIKFTDWRTDRKTENSSEKPNNCEDCIWNVCNYNKAFKDEATISKMEQVDKDINVRSKDEPATQTETQNSNLTFEKTDERCKGCKHYKLTCDLFSEICKYEPNSSEIPNNCEHITEDGVTCAKYPACNDCPDNPLNKVKGSERLVKGSEIPNNCEDEPQYEMGMGTLKCDNCSEYGSFKCSKCDGEMYFKRLEPKDEPQIFICPIQDNYEALIEDEPQTERSE